MAKFFYFSAHIVSVIFYRLYFMFKNVRYILNTPVQHSRHHSRVPGECNSNFGGLLSIYDQMFGTFHIEPAKRFGLCDPLYKSWNPLLDNIRHFRVMFHNWNKRKTWTEKLKVNCFFSENLLMQYMRYIYQSN